MINIFILSILSGLLTALSFDFPILSFLSWFSLLPFLYAINRSKGKSTLIVGLLFGLAFYGASVFWVAKVTTLGLIFLLGYLSIYSILFALGTKHFFKKPLILITLPCLWVAIEFLKESIWCGFGWANLGYSQYNNLYLIQAADILGTKFISFIIVMVNVLLYEFIFVRKFTIRKISFVVLVIVLCFSYSSYRLKTLKADDSIDVSLVQPNTAEFLKFSESGRQHILDKLYSLGEKTEKDPLVIFPEAAWPHTLNTSNIDQLAAFIRSINRDVLIGTVLQADTKFYNAALLFDRDGKLLNSYRKIKLVPFGEYIPLRRYLGFIDVINSIGDMSRGDGLNLFSYDGRRFCILICFEDVFPMFVSKASRSSDFLVNITNDGWFGGNPEATQHLSIMTMRAIENRISIIRAANTGISGWVSFRGESTILRNLEGDEVLFEDEGNFKVSLNKERSFYNRYGEAVMIIFCVFLLLGVIVKR